MEMDSNEWDGYVFTLNGQEKTGKEYYGQISIAMDSDG